MQHRPTNPAAPSSLMARPHPALAEAMRAASKAVRACGGWVSWSHLKTIQMITKTQGLDDHGRSFAQNVIAVGAHALPTDRPGCGTRTEGRLSSVQLKVITLKSHSGVTVNNLRRWSLYLWEEKFRQPIEIRLDYTVPCRVSLVF